MKNVSVFCRRSRLARLKPGLYTLLAALALASSLSAQTIPHVSGTFKTPEGKTPSQAGLKSIATIGAVAVYGSIDFQPYDSSGNRPTRILCGGNTYIPQTVRGWIAGNGTLVDNYTGAAGVDLVPTIGCTPSGLVIRAKITLAPSPDGRIPSFTWTEDKQIPSQSSVDWGAIAAAGVTAPVYAGYSTIQNAGASVAARNIVNFTNGGCVDNAATLATDCTLSGTGGGATLQTNGVNNTSQSTLNLKSSAATNGLTLTETNTGSGDVQLGLSGTLATTGGGTGSGANTGAAGKVLIGDGAGHFIEGDPLVQGVIAHDAAGAAINPVLAGCYANAAAPADVSADVDAVREWCLRNGSQVVNLASGGTLITAGQKTMASSLPVAIASDQSAVPVSGTVTSNIGTTNGLALDATLTGGNAKAQGNVASAASDSGNPVKIGGVFLTTQPTVTNAQRVDAQMSARGEQLVAPGVSGFAVTISANSSVNETQINGVALGSPSNYGTSPGAVSVQGVNAFITNTPAVSQSGNWTARIVGNAGGVLDAAGQNAASPANELLMAGQFNTTPTTITTGNVSPLQLDNAGNLKVNIIAGGGTGGGPADVGLSTAASETDAARQKVTSALRLWDQAAGAGSQLVGWRGDTTSGAWVNCKSGCSGGGFTDNSTFTTGTTSISPVGGLFDDTPPTAITTGKAASARITNNRALHMNLRNQAGTELATSGAPLRVDPTGSTTQPVSGTVTANIGTTNGLALDATLTGGTTKVQGNVASGASDSGNPLKVGGIFNTTQPTVTNAQRVDLQATARGAQIVATGVDAFAVNASQSGTWTVQPGNTANSTPWLVTDSADMSGTTPGTAPSKTAIVGTIFNSALPSPTNGQTLPLQSDSNGRLIVNCGTGCSASSGVTIATVTLFSATAATGTATSAAIQLPTFSTFGTLNITGSSITGSPSGCSIALASQATTGAPNSAAYQTIAFTPGSSFQSFAAGSNNTPTADKVVATYACTSYPSGGTISATFSPMTATAITNIGGAPFAQGQRTMANSISFVPASDYSSPDTVGAGSALNALNATATVVTNAQQGAAVLFASGTLAGTVVPEFSTDGGTTWSATLFQDPSSGNVFASQVMAGPTAATQYAILLPGGTSHARVRVSGFSSGSATASLRATFVATTPLAWAFDGFGKIKTSDYSVQAMLSQMLQLQMRPGSSNANYVRGTFGRAVTSTNDALDVYQKYPGAPPAPSASAMNALTPFHATVTTAQVIKATGGNLWAWMIYNPNASACFVDFFDTASPTLGTSVPRWTISIPATSGANVAPGQFAFANFSNAISVAAVTASGGASACGSAVTASIDFF